MKQLPDGSITATRDDVTLDVSLLAPHLDTTADAMRQQMREGTLRGLVERGEGDDLGRLRVTLRQGDRRWAATVEPDGTAYLADVRPPGSPGRGVGAATGPHSRSRSGPEGVRSGMARVVLRTLLIDAARRGETPTATALLDRTGPLFKRWPDAVRRGLAQLVEEDARAGRPFVTALLAAPEQPVADASRGEPEHGRGDSLGDHTGSPLVSEARRYYTSAGTAAH